MAEKEIRGSRFRRAASMTGISARVAARDAAARAMRAGGSNERATRQQLKSAESLVKVLGGMRGRGNEGGADAVGS